MGSKQKFTKSLILITEVSLESLVLNAHSSLLFYRHKIVKSHNEIFVENCFFISKPINFDLPTILFERILKSY